MEILRNIAEKGIVIPALMAKSMLITTLVASSTQALEMINNSTPVVEAAELAQIPPISIPGGGPAIGVAPLDRPICGEEPPNSKALCMTREYHDQLVVWTRAVNTIVFSAIAATIATPWVLVTISRLRNRRY